MSGALVLLYHRVADVCRDPHGLAVRPDRFAQHCEILRRRCNVVPLRDVMGSTRRVAITFDDGYADNAGDARGMLGAAGLPATFFITTGRLGERREVWWDCLEQIVLESDTTASTIDIEVQGRRLWADVRSPAARERAHLALFWRLRSMSPAAIEPVLVDLEAQLGVHRADRESYRWMTADELRVLAASDGIEIGAHTVMHPFLATLDAEEQWTEIDGSRRALEELLGKRPGLFSYPFGGDDAFGPVTAELVRKAGYSMGFAATGGIARADGDPLQIPRNAVGDWEPERFERWLDHWLSAP